MPILAARIDLVPAADRRQVIATLRKRHGGIEADWRACNWARMRAHEATVALEPAGPCPVQPVAEPRSGAR